MSEIFSDFSIVNNVMSNYSFTNPTPFRKDKIEMNLNIDYEIVDISEKKDEYYGLLEFKVKIESNYSDDEKGFSLEVAILGVFNASRESMEIDAFEKMLTINGLATLSQLVRSYIASTISVFGLSEKLMMPMINIYKLIETKQE
jgi:preprotein translocase subunit SecB